MKKTVSIIAFVILLSVFFCTSVFADTTIRPEYIGRVTKSYTLATDLTVYLRAMEFDPVIGEEIANVSGSPGIRVYQATTSVLVTVKIVNNTDYVKLIDPMYLDLYMTYATNYPNGYGIPRGILNVISYTDDLYVTYNYTNSNSMTIMSSVDWTIDGCIAVPPNSQLVGLTEIQYGSYYQYDSNGYTAKYPTLDRIELYSTPTVYGTTKTPIGMSSGGSSYNYTSQINDIVDFLDSIDDSNANIYSAVDGLENMVSQIYGSVDGLEGYVDGLEGLLTTNNSLLNNIKSLLTWSGSFPTVTYSSRFYNSYDGNIASNDNLTYHIEMVYGGAYPVMDSTDFETPNTIYQSIIYKHRVVAYITINNNTGKDYNHTGNFQLYRFIGSGYKTLDIASFYSDAFYNPYVLSSGQNTNVYFYLNRDNPVLYQGASRAVIYFDVYTDSSTAPTLNSTSIVANGWTQYTDELSEASADLATQSNNAHNQEQAYFNQNAQAIADTGLSNYHFSTVDGNGVASVSVDFTDLWNALGGWTSVYIFSLTLGLALSIIKHSPNAINRKIRNRQSE